MTTTHQSKISYGILAFIFILFYGPLIPYVINGKFNSTILSAIGLLTLSFAFVVYLFFKTSYTINDKQLHIKCGPFSYQPIAITDIKEISNTNSIIASPAPSFDRIAIMYNEHARIIISPKDKKSFVDDLKDVNPDIKNRITE